MRSFTFNTGNDPDTLFRKLSERVAATGFSLIGDAMSGSISGHGFEACYRLHQSSWIVDILRKPILVPWFLVQEKLADNFA